MSTKFDWRGELLIDISEKQENYNNTIVTEKSHNSEIATGNPLWR